MSERHAVRILSLFAAVVDANSECDPGKGAKNDLAVMDVCFFLLVQVETPPVAVSEKIQPGFLLWKSGRCGIANGKGVKPSKFSKMDSEDALKTINKTKINNGEKDGAGCSPRHLVAPCRVDTCYPTHMAHTVKTPVYLSTHISLLDS